MRKLHQLFLNKDRSTTLFLRLLFGFLCIILLLSSLTVYSFLVSKQNVRKEIVKYNTLMLNHTMDSYEKHFDMIKKQMQYFFLSEKAQSLHTNPRYIDFPVIQQDIIAFVSNAQLFVYNIVFYSKRDGLILEKGASTDVNTMFNVFYKNEAYPPEFWRGQFDADYSFHIFPAAVFGNHIYRDQQLTHGELIPVVIKKAGSSDFLMVVFLDSSKMNEAFHRTVNEDFMIYNDNGQTLFRRSAQGQFVDSAELRSHRGTAFILDDTYYFQVKGGGSGLTYVQRVPVERIASQTRLNITLIAALVISVAASIVISWVFAAGINNPLQKMIGAIRGENDVGGFRSSIREFNIIRHQIQDKNKMHKHLSFLHQLKAIRSPDEKAPSAFADKPFLFVLFHAMSGREEDREHSSFQTWLNYMNVCMEDRMAKAFPDSLTFRIENNQIVSLVYSDRREQLIALLTRLDHLFEQDKAFGTVTIAVSSVYDDSGQIADAYREVQRLVRERRMINKTQIVTEREEPQDAIGFTADQWKEFQANLREGNAEQLANLIKRAFGKWQGKEPTASALWEFGGDLIGKIKSEASPLVIGPGKLQAIFEHADSRMQVCMTMADLERLMIEWCTKASEAFKEKKQLKDPVTSFIVEYVNEHLAEEIYLDVLAERLNLSGGYLSTYFKEKTGMNIVDFINETRIMKATNLLADNKYKIQDVAEAVGYRNITSFNRMFKKYIGATPSEFRKRPDSDI
ncbi:helix-turn-helix domain-containing protein [Paenibacillus contaminans]|uniref:HTH araC/xylS-type domain-containing protein n=1 Tax=Paenibacillus contaminans TaxID=450362 RepID=A0A329MPP4_9BACL|nr:helix-turn-helix domain-containing protein [Paenibacillus contaminans]RAV21572.1 hypothetical protein DQG23_09935 [Paenibacillus contaminans]